MTSRSARRLLGLPVVTPDDGQILGVVESITVNPTTLVVDGFLIGRTGNAPGQAFLPRESLIEEAGDHLVAYRRLTKSSANSNRILGLAAWTVEPKLLVGFVYDCDFFFDNGVIDSLVIHQLIRTWRIPARSVVKITPKALLINPDTTAKLKITPFVQP